MELELCKIIGQGIFKFILDKLYFEDFLILASVSKSINLSINIFKKQYYIYFKNWYNKTRLIVENCFEKSFFQTSWDSKSPIFSSKVHNKITIQRNFDDSRLRGYSESKKYFTDSKFPKYEKSLTELVKTMLGKLDDCHLSCITQRGNYIYSDKVSKNYSRIWLKDEDLNDPEIKKLIEFDFLKRYYFLNKKDSSLFVVSVFKPGDDLCFFDIESDWEEKLDYFDSNGSLLFSLGQIGAHRFLFTRNLEYNNSHGDDDPIFQYENTINLQIVRESLCSIFYE